MLMSKALPSHKAPVLGRHYYRGGFVVRLLLMDMEFENIKEDFTAVEVNTMAVREHVAEIERAIRFIKEWL